MASSRSTPLDAEARLASLHLRRPQALARAIEEEVLQRGDAPGTRLGTKAELRNRFGVASTTVNEAIRVLENRGIVRAKPGPGGGVFVAERSGWVALSQLVLDFEDSATAITEVLAVRDALESLVCDDAALHHRKRDLKDLHRLLAVMASHTHDPSGYLRANWAFHRRVADLCANAFARSLYDSLLNLAEAQLAGVQGKGEFDGAANLATHEELLAAIESRNTGRVASAVQRHNRAARPASVSTRDA